MEQLILHMLEMLLKHRNTFQIHSGQSLTPQDWRQASLWDFSHRLLAGH